MWRAESGAGQLEYGALILVVATVVVAVLAAGLPTKVADHLNTAICRIGSDADCETSGGDSQADGPSGDTGEPDGGDGGQDGDPDGGQDNPSEGPTETDPLFNDPSIDPEVAAANAELSKAQKAKDKADDAYGKLDDELLKTIADVVGLTDAKKCLTEGDLVACLWTVVGLSPFGKGAKLLKRIPKIVKLFSRWRKLKKAKDAAKTRLTKAKGKRDKPLKQCQANSFTADTPVLLADGRHVEISEVEVGDRVAASNPLTGESGARRVTNVIVGRGAKELVDVGLNTAGRAGGTLTATTEHPIWVENDARWVPAEDLDVGDTVRTPSGTPASVASVHAYPARTSVYNLTVAGIHTYYVSTGTVDVLAHNKGPGCGDIWMDPKRVEHHYKHAKDFGVDKPFNKQSRQEFLDALGHFMRSPNNTKITGTFRGQKAVHYVDPDTGQHVSVAADGPNVGKVLGAWKTDPGDPQFEYLMKQGVL